MRAAGAARGRPRGVNWLPGCGASWVGRSPTPYRSSFRRAAGARYLLAVGAVCRRGDSSPTPQHALLRDGFVRCGGGTRAPGGGEGLLPGYGASLVGRSPTPDRPFLGRATQAATHWLWVRCAGVGTRHGPHSAHSCELALRAVGATQGRPGGGGHLLPGC